MTFSNAVEGRIDKMVRAFLFDILTNIQNGHSVKVAIRWAKFSFKQFSESKPQEAHLYREVEKRVACKVEEILDGVKAKEE